MAVKLISLKCPDCNATINIEGDRKQAFCTYCGAKIIINNDNEYVYRRVDEAEIKKAETDRIIKLKEMELAEKIRESEEKERASRKKLALRLGVIGLIMMLVGSLLGSASGNPDSGLYYIALLGFFPLIAAGVLSTSSIEKKKKKL